MSLSSPSLNTQSFNVASPLIVTRDNIGHVMPPILVKIGKTQKEWQALVRENYSTCRHFDSVSMRKKEATLLNLRTFFKGHPLPVGNYLDIINISAEQMGLPFPNNPEKGGGSLPKLAILCGLVLAGIGIASLKSPPNNRVSLKEKVDLFGSLLDCIRKTTQNFHVVSIPEGLRYNGFDLTRSSGHFLLNGEPLSAELTECVAEKEKKQKEIEDFFTTNLSQKKWQEALAYALQVHYRQRDRILKTLVDDCDDLDIQEKAIDEMDTNARDLEYPKLVERYLLKNNYDKALSVALKIRVEHQTPSLQQIINQSDDTNIQEKAILNMDTNARDLEYPKLVNNYLLKGRYAKALATALNISSVEKITPLQNIVDRCTDPTIQQEAIQYMNAFQSDLPLQQLVDLHLSRKRYTEALTTALTMTSGFKNQCLNEIIVECFDLEIQEKAADAMITARDKHESAYIATSFFHRDFVYMRVRDLVYMEVVDEALSNKDYEKALEKALKMTSSFKRVSLRKIINKCNNPDIKKKAEEEAGLFEVT